MSFLGDVAGEQSALGVYDIGKLQLLYVTRTAIGARHESGIWQQRAQFETREIEGKQFYVRTDPQSQRVVAFAMDDDYLVLGNQGRPCRRELSLCWPIKRLPRSASKAGSSMPSKTAKEPGEMRLVVHLAEVDENATVPHLLGAAKHHRVAPV